MGFVVFRVNSYGRVGCFDVIVIKVVESRRYPFNLRWIRSRTVQPVAQLLYRLSYRAHYNLYSSPIILLGWSKREELDRRGM